MKYNLRNFTLSILLTIFFTVAGITKSYSQPKNVTVSNIKASKATITWVTDKPETGYIKYGTASKLASIAYDVRGENFQGITHFVNLENLTPETLFYYEITQQRYSLTTGKKFTPLLDEDTIYGQIFLNQGNPAKGVIVSLMIKDTDKQGTSGNSQLCSLLTDNNGYWYYNLKNTRNDTLNANFIYSKTGDTLILDITGPKGETYSTEIDTSADTPVKSINLSSLEQ